LFLSGNAADAHVDFEGNRRSLKLLTSVPVVLGGAGRSRLTLSVEPRGNRVELFMGTNAELANRDDASTQIAKSLLPDAVSVEFSYFGKARSDKAATWHEQWVREKDLPQLIRVDVRYPDNDVRIWPELVVAPRITADVQCVHDALNNQCRGR
jgi:general secretion pathway protein J